MRKLPLIALLCTISVVLINMPAVADYQPAPGQLVIKNNSVLNSDGSCDANISLSYALKTSDNDVGFRAVPNGACGYRIEKNEAGSNAFGFLPTVIGVYAQGTSYQMYEYFLSGEYSTGVPCWDGYFTTGTTDPSPNPYLATGSLHSAHQGPDYAYGTSQCVTTMFNIWWEPGCCVAEYAMAVRFYPVSRSVECIIPEEVICYVAPDISEGLGPIETGTWTVVKDNVGLGATASVTIH